MPNSVSRPELEENERLREENDELTTEVARLEIIIAEKVVENEWLREAIRAHRKELDAAALYGPKRDRDDVDNALYNAALIPAGPRTNAAP